MSNTTPNPYDDHPLSKLLSVVLGCVEWALILGPLFAQRLGYMTFEAAALFYLAMTFYVVTRMYFHASE